VGVDIDAADDGGGGFCKQFVLLGLWGVHCVEGLIRSRGAGR
jgi:hypothetical protein